MYEKVYKEMVAGGGIAVEFPNKEWLNKEGVRSVTWGKGCIGNPDELLFDLSSWPAAFCWRGGIKREEEYEGWEEEYEGSNKNKEAEVEQGGEANKQAIKTFSLVWHLS